MAEIALAGAGWVASPIVSKLLNEGFSYLGNNNIKDRLENLETTVLPQFQLVIEAAERSEHKTKLKLWLKKLKDAMYEAEEILDLYQYELLDEKVHLLSHSTPKPFGKFVSNLKKGMSSAFSTQKKKLRDSLIKLESIAAEAKTFRELLGMRVGNSTANDTTTGRQPNVATSLPPAQVFGRNQDSDEIIDKYLLDPSESCESEIGTVRRRRSYSVVAIVGMGGAGKTTLAQLVYNDQRVVNNFDTKMWVCMSRKIDVFRLTREMIESASKEECPRLENLDALQSKLIAKIESKKVLLVLDDVWCYKSENEMEWEQLVAPLAFGERGSKILLTTRSENMPNMPVALRPQKVMELKDLEEDPFISLFMYYAFGGSSLSDIYLQEELEKIGKDILQKLSKSPLAAKAVGSHLSKRLEVDVWRATLQQDNLSDTQKTLIWSYHRLDAHLQRCFCYFSLFPKGHRFKAEEMVHLWMAEGFIKSSDDRKRMEDIGNSYFDELVSSSFLQLLKDYDNTYDMHDLFHDLAESISKEDYFRIEGNQVKNIPPSTRYLYISGGGMKKCSIDFCKLENLRTLIIHGPLSINENDLILAIEKLKKLRVLLLYYCSIKALPKFIGDLKHMRYLGIGLTNVVELPVSLGKLYHLQLLKLPDGFIHLPRSLRNLLSLRHLEASYMTFPTLPDIGRLSSLQGLKRFKVKKKKGHDITQLQNLNEIRGSLTISRLENVEGEDQAIGANLKDKKHLDSLCLQWRDDSSSHMEVMEVLQPPPNLRKLEIRGYKSLRYPSWLTREGCLEGLEFLKIDSTSFEDLPTMSKLFSHCQELQICDLLNLRKFPLLPQSLKELIVKSCPLLIFVSEEELQNSGNRKKSITAVQSSQLRRALELMGDVSYIRERVSRDCLNVKKLMESEKVDMSEDFQKFVATLQGEEMSMKLDYIRLSEAYCHCQDQRLEAIFGRREKSELILPSTLQRLVIADCPNITDGALSLCLAALTSLKFLKLEKIRTITTVSTDHLMALCDLEIADCHFLKSLTGLHTLLSLKTLLIYKCPCLELEILEGEGGGTSSSDRLILPPSLQSLAVEYNTNVKRFAIGDLPDLVMLKLSKLASLASLSLSGLTPLRKLEITDCPELSALDCSLGTKNVQKLPPAPLSEVVHTSSVEELRISSYATLSMLLSGSSSSGICLTSLKILELWDCEVQSLPKSLKILSSLETLDLSGCLHISSLSSNLPESLKALRLSRCRGLTLLSDLPNSLRFLELDDCPGISSLPMCLPESLTTIRIHGCPVLKNRCQEPKGEEWPKIACIPYRYID